MPYTTVYSMPEEAFEVRIQCTEEQIQAHCDAEKENVGNRTSGYRRDFDDKGGLTVPVYHVYKNGESNNRMVYWYTLEIEEVDEFEFDIRMLPNFEDNQEHADLLQYALDHKLVRFCNSILTKPPKD
jgi:hypothetical protein|tara:strand:- start:2853 stop:3233 length:381 start_codon:yes stop_codon:yes gene_type:complete